jgi:hypothetical protein
MANGQELKQALGAEGRRLLEEYDRIADPTVSDWETLRNAISDHLSTQEGVAGAFAGRYDVGSLLTNGGYATPTRTTDPFSGQVVSESDRALGREQTRRRMRLEDPFAAFRETVQERFPRFAQAPEAVQRAATAPYSQLYPQYLMTGAFGPQQFQGMPFGDFLSSGYRPTAQGMTHGMGQLFNLLTGNTPWGGQPGQVRSVARTLGQDANLVFDTALTPFYQQHGPMMGNALLSQLKDMYSNWQSSDIGRGLDYGTEGQQALAFLQGQDLPFLRNVLPGAMGQYFNVAAPETPR